MNRARSLLNRAKRATAVAWTMACLLGLIVTLTAVTWLGQITATTLPSP